MVLLLFNVRVMSLFNSLKFQKYTTAAVCLHNFPETAQSNLMKLGSYHYAIVSVDIRYSNLCFMG